MATVKQTKAIAIALENGGNVSKAMREAGYPPATAKNPQRLTRSKAWLELVEEHLSNEDLAQKHKELLNSTKIEHMTFPLGPKTDAEVQNDTHISDESIIAMLKDVNCKVRKIVHGETARHVYYWAADNKARKDGLDMAYKLRGSYAAEKSVSMNLNVDARLPDSKAEALRQEYERKLKESLID